MLLERAGQCCQFQHPERFPTHLTPFAYLLPGIARTPGLGVDCGGDTERFGRCNPFAQQVNQCLPNAVVGDASRGEKEFHDAFPFQFIVLLRLFCQAENFASLPHSMPAHQRDEDEASLGGNVGASSPGRTTAVRSSSAPDTSRSRAPRA